MLYLWLIALTPTNGPARLNLEEVLLARGKTKPDVQINLAITLDPA